MNKTLEGLNITTGIFAVQEAGTWHFTFTAIARTEKDDLYGLKMTKQSDVTEETIAYALRANSKDDIGEGYNHYETVSMSAITKVEVGEEVAVEVVRKSRLVDWIMDMGDDYGARFTGFKL